MKDVLRILTILIGMVLAVPMLLAFALAVPAVMVLIHHHAGAILAGAGAVAALIAVISLLVSRARG